VFFPPENLRRIPKALIRASALLLAIAAVSGALNHSKMRTLRSTAIEAISALEQANQVRIKHEAELRARESTIAAQKEKLAEREGKILASEEKLAQVLNENQQLQAKLQDKDSEIVALREQIDEKQPGAINPGAPSTVELQAQLDDARRQLDNAEREKSLLAEKIQAVREKSSQLEEEKKRRTAASSKSGVRGTILAVNQAYNFVVLNLGSHNGVEPHSEMLIVRDGTCIGKIRISSIEPATAIGDIITSTLARGVQVQPGDIAIYAGSNP
jgi:chromosome segregation ATPase